MPGAVNTTRLRRSRPKGRLEYFAARRQREKPAHDLFQATLRALMAEWGLSETVLRPRFGGHPALFDEVFRKRRRIPSETEAREIAMAMNLRRNPAGRERFLAAAREARLLLEEIRAAETSRG